MAKMAVVQNGTKRRTKKRNGVARKTATVKAKRNPARRVTTLAAAKAAAKRNGLVIVSKTVANGRRKKRRGSGRKRRNGLATAAGYTRSRNGLLGKTKNDARVVGGVLGGAVATKLLSRIVVPFVAPYMAQVGAGSFTEIVVDGVIALVAIPLAVGKLSPKDMGNARLGGLLVVAIDGIEMVAPNLLGYNPFNTSAVVVANGQALVTPKAVAAIVEATDASPASKAQVAGAMSQLSSGTGGGGASGGMNTRQAMPLMNE
jgi:hypothetical protein